MGTSATKEAIVEAYIATVEAASPRAVQVAKLIKELGINRNTFYYHFPSKYDVALYVFRCDLAPELVSAFPESELVSVPIGNGDDTPLPFYVHREIGARTLDFGEFFKCLVRCVMKRPQFYGKLFDASDTEFRALVDGLSRPAVADDLHFALGGRYLPQCTFELFLHRYTAIIYDTATYFLKHSLEVADMLDDAVNPFWNMPHESLVHELQLHTVARPRPAR